MHLNFVPIISLLLAVVLSTSGLAGNPTPFGPVYNDVPQELTTGSHILQSKRDICRQPTHEDLTTVCIKSGRCGVEAADCNSLHNQSCYRTGNCLHGG